MMEEFLIVCLFSAHICLFFDMSPLQKKPTCKMNFLIACSIATVPPMLFSYFTAIPSLIVHYSLLGVITLVSSITVIATIQKYLDYEINF